MLRARDLWVAAPGLDRSPVVRGFSLGVGRGEWVALTGPNGGGKSRFLLALAGLAPILRGTLELDGRPFGPQAPQELRACVSVVLQDPSCQLLQRTVTEEVALTAHNLGRSEQETSEELSRWACRFGLSAELGADPRALSAGRQQLVLLAAALAARPRVLLVDEGGAHLDGEARAVVLGALRDEVRGGLALLWVTQVPEECAAADRTVTLGEDAKGSSLQAPASSISAPAGLGPVGPPLLRLAVEAWDGCPGPHVPSPRPFELAISPGLTALEGRNGSGKSVLLAAAAGVIQVPQIRVEWLTAAVPPLLVSQYPESQIFEERVADEVVFAAVSRGVARARATEEAARHGQVLGVGGQALLERRTWDLSAGEKRLVQVIGALVAPSDLLLLDEPTSGIDPARCEALARLVAQRSRRSAVLVASQDARWLELAGASRLRIDQNGWEIPVPVKKRIDRGMS